MRTVTSEREQRSESQAENRVIYSARTVLIRCGFFRVIDDDRFNRTLRGMEFKSELFVESGEYRNAR